MTARKNILTVRMQDGVYDLKGKSGFHVLFLSSGEWRDLGLKPLRKGQEVMVDLQVSGVPKKKKK